jgi:hypothetical protein
MIFRKKPSKKLEEWQKPSVITFFAWLPVTIGNETRWLELVTVRREWQEYGAFFEPYWSYEEFIDEN